MKRRDAIKTVGLTAATIPMAGSLMATDTSNEDKSTTILFQGDSITDAGRNRGAYYANNGAGMGQGYVRHTVTELLGDHPHRDLRFYNRGISGHKVFQLANRWEEDCLQLRPDVLSIMIGVNDFWHTLTNGYQGTVQTYETDLDALLDRTLTALPDLKIIICEPFVVLGGTSIDTDDWIPAFRGYQEACKRMANKYKSAVVPFQSVFDKALEHEDASYWCPDGVHPSMAGNYLMSQAWLEVFHGLKVF